MHRSIKLISVIKTQKCSLNSSLEGHYWHSDKTNVRPAGLDAFFCHPSHEWQMTNEDVRQGSLSYAYDF